MDAATATAIATGVGLVVGAGGVALVGLVKAGADARAAGERSTQLPAAPAPQPAPAPAAQVIGCAVHTEQLAGHERRLTTVEGTLRELEIEIAGELAELKTLVRERTRSGKGSACESA